jgi:hypothetical protein
MDMTCGGADKPADCCVLSMRFALHRPLSINDLSSTNGYEKGRTPRTIMLARSRTG